MAAVGGVWLVAFVLVTTVSASPTLRRSGSCGDHVTLTSGESIFLSSPRFPYLYPTGINCLYTATSPAGTAMKMECGTFNVNCDYDTFYFSPAGDPSFSGPYEYYCGSGTLDLTTTGNSFAAAFISDVFYFNWRYLGFNCRLSVVDKSTVVDPSPQTPPPPTTPSPPTPPPSGTCECGVKGGSRIVGGEETEVNEWPWQVGLIRYSDSNGGPFCGGTLINAEYVVTAAHCVKDFAVSDFFVSLGDHDSKASQESSWTKYLPVASAEMHENYNEVTIDNDIALLRLGAPVQFNAGIKPACLPFKFSNSDFHGQDGFVTGWGTTSFGGSTSNVLKEVQLPILTNSECNDYLHGAVTQNMMCTLKADNDACQGDSGGPLTTSSGDLHYLVGIVSWGHGCGDADSPGVYARVTKYLDWIESKVTTDICKP